MQDRRFLGFSESSRSARPQMKVALGRIRKRQYKPKGLPRVDKESCGNFEDGIERQTSSQATDDTVCRCSYQQSLSHCSQRFRNPRHTVRAISHLGPEFSMISLKSFNSFACAFEGPQRSLSLIMGLIGVLRQDIILSPWSATFKIKMAPALRP